MENFNGFPSNNFQPFPHFQNASSFLNIHQPLDYGTLYPDTQQASPPFQPHQSYTYFDDTIGMTNFEPIVSLDSFPFVVPSRYPVLETAHSVLETAHSVLETTHSIQSQHIPESAENKKLQAKIARANRKKAREMSANRRINASMSSSSSGPLSSSRSTRSTRPSSRSNMSTTSDPDHYIIYTPYNVKLSFVLQKLLTCTDVGDLGRILLPKREAEENLPALESREGIQIVMREVYSNTEWKLQYRFWANHKGRMYLLDHCDDFLKKNMLEAGDQLKIYQDELGNLYFTIKKKEKPQESVGNNYMCEVTEEEESSLRTLLEALKHNDDSEANSLNDIYASASSSTERNYYS